MRDWKLLAVAAGAFVALDFVWLGVLMKGFYDRELGDLARRHLGQIAPRWPAALLVYLAIPAGLMAFARPAMGPDASLATAFGWGAAFGLVVYGTYDLTNYAMLERWSLKMIVADILWGSTLCGVVAALVHAVEPRLVG